MGKENSIEILKYVYSNGWTKSSDLADGLGLHIATCSKYLEELTEINIMEKREIQGQTRKVNQYRVKDPKIQLEFNLQTPQTDPKAFEFYKNLYGCLIESTEDVCGSVPIERIDFQDANEEEALEDLIGSIRDILEFNERTFGLKHTKKLVKRSSKHIYDDYDETVLNSFIDVLPPKYFDLLMEEV